LSDFPPDSFTIATFCEANGHQGRLGRGMNASHFKGVAKKVNNEIYDGRALILETTVTKASTASFDKYEVSVRLTAPRSWEVDVLRETSGRRSP